MPLPNQTLKTLTNRLIGNKRLKERTVLGMDKIVLEHVTVNFSQKKKNFAAVDDVSLTIKQGEIFGVVGLSGAGKSTLIRTLNLLQRPSSGSIKIDGTEITQLPADKVRKLRQKIGMIFQHFNLIHNKTVGENIAFALKAGNYDKKALPERIKALLDLVDLGDKMDSYPNQLSGGQKQRIGIARALANNPEILLCDEATSALDVETTEEILRILAVINQKLGITIVFITHELEVAKKLFQRMAVMENGKVIEVNTTYNIFANPKAGITQKLVGRYLNLHLPSELLPDLAQGRLIELRYQGDNTLSPLITDVAKQWDVAISIIHGKIDYIQNDVIGILLVYVTGDKEAVEQAFLQLSQKVFATKEIKEAI